MKKEILEKFPEVKNGEYDAFIKDTKELFGKMRGFTPEEQKRYNESIKKICKPTGRNLFDVLEENEER